MEPLQAALSMTPLGAAAYLPGAAAPGRYEYLCRIHPPRKAKVTVTGSLCMATGRRGPSSGRTCVNPVLGRALPGGWLR